MTQITQHPPAKAAACVCGSVATLHLDPEGAVTGVDDGAYHGHCPNCNRRIVQPVPEPTHLERFLRSQAKPALSADHTELLDLFDQLTPERQAELLDGLKRAVAVPPSDVEPEPAKPEGTGTGVKYVD